MDAAAFKINKHVLVDVAFCASTEESLMVCVVGVVSSSESECREAFEVSRSSGNVLRLFRRIGLR